MSRLGRRGLAGSSMVRRVRVWPGAAGMARHGEDLLGRVRRDMERYGRHGVAGLVGARPSRVRQARRVEVRLGTTRRVRPWYGRHG